jgi:hypothetical protein
MAQMAQAHKNQARNKKVKVVQIIARMNVGGPAVIVADLMRSIDSSKVEQTLITGYCDENEADYLETVATDIKATRIAGLGRSVSLGADIRAFFALVAMIKKIAPDVIHTHTAKAGVLGRFAAILAGPRAKRVHTFHGHLLHGYFTGWKVKLVIAIEKFLAKRTDVLVAVGNQVKNDLLAAGIGKAELEAAGDGSRLRGGAAMDWSSASASAALASCYNGDDRCLNASDAYLPTDLPTFLSYC